jgi:hypothetical protein
LHNCYGSAILACGNRLPESVKSKVNKQEHCMKTSKTLVAFVITIAVLVSQVGAVFAAPALHGDTISGTVNGLACETDPITGTKTFLVTVKPAGGASQTVRVSQSTAEFLGLIEPTLDGGPDCSQEALELAIGMDVTILATNILLDEGPKHPVGDALATYFDEITDYDTIMTAHDEGDVGFGVIAQALWLLQKINDPNDPEFTLQMILDAKQNNNFSEFDGFEDAQNWSQFRKAVLDGAKKNNLGVVMSEKDQDNGNSGSNGSSNGNIQGNSNSHTNKNKNNEKGNNGDNGNNEEKGNGKNK